MRIGGKFTHAGLKKRTMGRKEVSARGSCCGAKNDHPKKPGEWEKSLPTTKFRPTASQSEFKKGSLSE